MERLGDGETLQGMGHPCGCAWNLAVLRPPQSNAQGALWVVKCCGADGATCCRYLQKPTVVDGCLALDVLLYLEKSHADGIREVGRRPRILVGEPGLKIPCLTGKQWRVAPGWQRLGVDGDRQ